MIPRFGCMDKEVVVHTPKLKIMGWRIAIMKKTSRRKVRESTAKSKRKMHKGFHIAFAVLSVLTALAATAGLVFVLVYKSGQAGLMQSVEAKMPDAQQITDIQEEIIAKEKARLATVEWQDNWVTIDGKVYAYNEKCINLLVMGVDKPGNISGETDYEGWEAGQTDAIFLVSLNPTEGNINIVGIPRNSMVNVDIYNEENHKIDTVYDQICLQYAFAGGGQAGLDRMKKTVSELLYGLPVHGAFAVGYDAVSVVNDMVGGVDIEVLEDMQKENKVFVPGNTVHLDGKLALTYVRSRNYGQLGSPTLRLQRQKQYITALIQKSRGMVKKNPVLVKDMYSAAAKYMNTDVTLDEVVYLAAQAMDYRFDGSSIKLLQGEDKAVEISEEKLRLGEEREPFYNDYYLNEDSIKGIMMDVFYDEVTIGEQKSQ